MNWKKHKLPALLMLMIVVYSCASMGTPDGGPYDEEPPKFVRSSPKPYATNNKDKKIAIEFDEFIKLEKTSEKVVVSPPQLEQPDIKASGRRVLVNLMDSLKPNTTYTIDFSDAIVEIMRVIHWVIILFLFLQGRLLIHWKFPELCWRLLTWNQLKG